MIRTRLSEHLIGPVFLLFIDERQPICFLKASLDQSSIPLRSQIFELPGCSEARRKLCRRALCPSRSGNAASGQPDSSETGSDYIAQPMEGIIKNEEIQQALSQYPLSPRKGQFSGLSQDFSAVRGILRQSVQRFDIGGGGTAIPLVKLFGKVLNAGIA